jgi:VWFA-related protein
LSEGAPTTEPLHLVVYIDNLFIEPFSRRRAIQATRGFLADRLKPGDQVMVVTSERALHVRQTFTADRAQVFRTLAEIDEMSGLGVQGASESKRIGRLIDDAKSYSEAFQLADFHAKETFADLQRSMATLQEMIDLLAGLRGRTAILFVSDGLPMVAAADLFSMVQSKFGKLAGTGAPSLQYDARHRFRELAAAANSRQVTFYTLEAAGLRSHASLSAEHRSGFSGSQIDVDLTRDFNRQEPLQMLAEDTGGLAAINTNNLDGFLDRVAEDFRTYYSLGFAPLHSEDGRLHTLEVKLRDSRYQVRHRAAYRNRGPDERFVDAVLATLRYGAGKRSGADLNAELKLSAAHPTEGLYAVPFEASVPFREVTFVPQGDTFRGRLDLVIVAIDEAGESSLPQRESLPLSIPVEHMEAVLGEHVVYAAELQMRAGVHYLAVGFRDSISGRTGIVRRGLRVGRN